MRCTTPAWSSSRSALSAPPASRPKREFQAEVCKKAGLDRMRQVFMRAVRRRNALVYHPLWVLRYLFRGRAFQVVVDGYSGEILYGKAPGNTCIVRLRWCWAWPSVLSWQSMARPLSSPPRMARGHILGSAGLVGCRRRYHVRRLPRLPPHRAVRISPGRIGGDCQRKECRGNGHFRNGCGAVDQPIALVAAGLPAL